MEKNTRTLSLAGLLTEVEYKFHIEISEPIKLIYNAFHKQNKKLYVVGGAVRDAVLGVKPKDFDLVTDALPTVVQSILADAGITNFPIGLSYGVIAAIINNEQFEIATFREEVYTGGDGRRPSEPVKYVDMATDVARRDLTINALYYDIAKGVIIDLVGGIEDIKNKKIRTVGNPMNRFEEDRLRTLRALRFAHRFGSSLDKETIDAIIHYKNLPGISSERIRDEFLKSIRSSKKPEEFLKQFTMLGLMPKTFPGMNIDTNFINGLKSPILAIAKLLNNNDIRKITQSLTEAKYTGWEIDSVTFLIRVRNGFKDFDKMVFDPKTDSKWFLPLIDKRNIVFSRSIEKGGLTKEDLSVWAEIIGLDVHVINTFSIYNLPISAKDAPHLTGKDLGDYLAYQNSNLFLKNL